MFQFKFKFKFKLPILLLNSQRDGIPESEHVSTQLRGHHQAGIVMKLKMAVYSKQLALANCLCA
jgi:hypothetical protein